MIEGPSKGSPTRCHQLTVLAIHHDFDENFIAALESFQITLVCAVGLSELDELSGFDAVLIDTTIVEPAQLAEIVKQLRQKDIAIVSSANSDSADAALLMDGTADAIAWLDRTPLELAASLRFAHRHVLAKRQLRICVQEKDTKISQMKLVGQAKAIVAEQLDISEAAALRHLRAEARNRRRPMHELASVVLEARQIIRQDPQEDGAAEDQQSRRRPRIG